jgi:hypothetical protein
MEGRSRDCSEIGGWFQNGLVLEGLCARSQQGLVRNGRLVSEWT